MVVIRGRPPGKAAQPEIEILEALDAHPGFTIRELADLLTWEFSTTRYYLAVGQRAGNVYKRLAARYYLTEE